MRSMIISMLVLAGFKPIEPKGKLPTFGKGDTYVEVMSSAVFINGESMPMGGKDFLNKRCRNRYDKRPSSQRREFRARKPRLDAPTVRVNKTSKDKKKVKDPKLATNVGNPREKTPSDGSGKKGQKSRKKVIGKGGKSKRKLYKSPKQLKHEAYLKSVGKAIAQ